MKNYISTAALYYPNESYLAHHGIKGQKWGVRRYQNPDGSLTPAGIRRYGTVENYRNAQSYKSAKKAYNKSFNNAYYRNYQVFSPIKKHREANTKRWEDAIDKAGKYANAKKAYKQSQKEYKNSPEGIAARKERNKKIAKAGAIAAGTLLATYGAYKLNQKANQKLKEHYLDKSLKFLKLRDSYLKEFSGYELAAKNTKFSDKKVEMAYADVLMKRARGAANSAKAADASYHEYINKAVDGGYSLKEKYRALRGNLR